MENQTTVTYFVLLGLSYNPPVQMFLFFTFSLIYLVTLLGNMMIMIVIRSNRNLHSPMYFFLSHLSFLDICYSSVTVPKLLTNLYGSKRISHNGCIAQMFLILLTGTTEAFILAAMAFDRYTAICKPMHYVQIMNSVFCRLLVGSAWTICSLYAMINTLSLLKLVFCGPNIINHFSCELPSLLALSCSETFLNRIIFFITANTLGGSSFFVILASYIQIISTVLKMHSAAAKRKTFSTCSSHLIVVILFYGTALFRYMSPTSSYSAIVDEFFSIQYSISTPMLNPIIYSLKTKEVKEAIKKLIGYKSLMSGIMYD
ncbi:olfactory receptor 5A1-like [Hemicordylus capensis]|uniref:olfactory receptor 5A1-like n=1 Tax=Hemicordylus capensis TaxID=884348 RepID=UPI002302DC86|nr:olfactory receptor 5A1-like [Hemicordylus capensis]